MKNDIIPEQMSREILEDVPAMIAFHDPQQNILWANRAYREATRLSLEELKGKKCHIAWGLDKLCRNCPVTKALETGEPAETELTPENRDHWPETRGSWLSKAVPIKNAGSRIIGAVETIFDITERKQGEEEIQRNYQMQRVLSAMLHISLSDISLEKQLQMIIERITTFSPWIEKGSILLVEDDPEVLVMKALRGHVTPLQTTCARVPFGRCLCGRAALMKEIQFASCLDDRHEIVYEGITPHGHYCVPILSAGKVLGVINMYLREGHRRKQGEEEFLIAIANTLAGIIVHKRAEEEQARLRRQLEALWKMTRMIDAEFRNLCDYVLNGIVAFTQSRYGFYGFLNEDESVLTLYSWTRKTMEECQIQDKLREFPIVKAGLWGDAVRERRMLIINNYQADHPSKKGLPEGHVPIARILVVPIFSHGRIVSLAAVANKATEYTEEDAEQINAFATSAQAILDRKEAGEVLREAERRYRELVEGLEAIVWEADPQTWQFTFVSKRAEAILGYPVNQWLNDANFWVDHIHPDDRDEAVSFCQLATQEGRNHEFEYRMIKADGSAVWLRDVVTVECADGKPVRLKGVMVDIRELKRKEAEKEEIQAQLLQAQKMEAVGRLAGGVAHDFNNMLSAILGYADLAMMELAPSEKLYADLEEIRKAGQRAATLTRQLLAFARKQTVAPRVLDLNETVAQMLKILQRLIGEDVEILWKPGASLWPVKMDPSQVDQILANLAVNARDAIGGVGKLTIETENVILDEAYCTQHLGFDPGEYVMLAVIDDGCGMDRETLDRIFEPFFTTKEPGKGTGLGLATVYGIVKQNNGFVNVYSEPGQGTTFKIYLPRFTGAARDKEAMQAQEIPKGRGETVLVVEDEPQILSLGKRLLETLGYRVLTASTPTEAVRLAKEHSDKIDLLLTDVVMPEMNGRELSHRLLAIQPRIKVLFMSGYTANVIAHHDVLEEGVAFIQKPLELRQLAVKIREVLEPK